MPEPMLAVAQPPSAAEAMPKNMPSQLRRELRLQSRMRGCLQREPRQILLVEKTCELTPYDAIFAPSLITLTQARLQPKS
jgi:hypothetical protein